MRLVAIFSRLAIIIPIFLSHFINRNARLFERGRAKVSAEEEEACEVYLMDFNDRSPYIRMYEIHAVDSDYHGTYHLSSFA